MLDYEIDHCCKSQLVAMFFLNLFMLDDVLYEA